MSNKVAILVVLFPSFLIVIIPFFFSLSTNSPLDIHITHIEFTSTLVAFGSMRAHKVVIKMYSYHQIAFVAVTLAIWADRGGYRTKSM